MDLDNIFTPMWDDDGELMYDEIELDEFIDDLEISEVI